MHVAARVDHAISAALVLPEPSEPPVAGAALADELGISYPYLMTIIDPLKKAGLARVRRGPQGGLSLARGSHDITLADVIWAVDAPTVVVSRSSHGGTETGGAELLPRLWATAHEAVFAVFAQVPLAQMRASGTSPAGTSAGGDGRTAGRGPHEAGPASAQLG